MNKISKKIAKISGWVGLTLLGLLILLLFALNTSLLQTKLLNRWLAQQSETMGIIAKVQQVDVDLLSRNVKLFGVEVYDHHQNLLADVGTLKTSVRGFSASHLTLGTTLIFDIVFQLRRYEEDSLSNLQYILDFFNTSPRDSNAPKFAIRSSAIFLNNGDFSFVDEKYSRGDTFQFIDFKNVSLSDINFTAKNVDIVGDNVLANIEKLTFKEKKGFEVWKFSSRLNLSSKGIIARKTDIITTNSDLDFDVKFTTQSWEDYRNFITNVKLYANFRNSYLNFEDLVYFAPKLEGKHNHYRISGNILGYVNDFQAKNFEVLYGRNTRFYGDILMAGLPKFDTTFFDVSIRNLTTSPEDIDDFLLPNNNKITIPNELYKLGNTSVFGEIIGYSSDLKAFLNVNSAMGNVQTEFKFSFDTSKENFDFSGHIDHSNLALRELLNEETLGNNLNLYGSFDGNFSAKNGMDLSVDMVCRNVEYQNRKIDLISIKGDWIDRLVSASISMDDDDGTAEFSGELSLDPKNLFLEASGFFKDVDLVAFRLLNDTNQPLLSSKFSGKIYNLNIDSLIGNVSLSDLRLKTKDTIFELNNFTVSQQISPKGISTKIDSDFFRADVFGNYKFSGIDAIWNDVRINYLSAFEQPVEEVEPLETKEFHRYETNENKRKHLTSQTLDLMFSVHKTDGLFSYFLPEIDLPQGAEVKFGYNGTHQPLTLNIVTKDATVYGFHVSDLNLTGTTYDSIFEINLDARNLHIKDNRYFEDVSIVAKFEDDAILWKLDWIGNSVENRGINGKLDGRMNILDGTKISFNIQNSELLLSGQLWQFDPNNTIVIDTTGVHFENIRFYNKNDFSEYLSLNGELSKVPNSVLNLVFNRYQLAAWTPLIGRIGLDFDGAISGTVSIFDFYSNLRFNSNLRIEDFLINKFNYGTAFLQTTASERLSESYVNFDIRNNGTNYLSAVGYFYPNREDQNLNFKISVSEMDLSFFKNYVNTFSSSLTGKFGGKLTLDGLLKKPNFYGDVMLDDAVMKIDFLNTSYAVNSEKIAFNLDSIMFIDANLEDVLNKTQSALSGGLYHDRFKNFRLNLGLQMNSFFALNTTHFQNETFFGRAFVTGNARLEGRVENILIDVQGRTERGTELNVNQSARVNISETNQFIHFVTSKQENADTVILNGSNIETLPANIIVRLNIDVTPDASVFFDMDAPPISGLINAQGSGNLRMNFESRNNLFTLFGDYVLQDGFYDFSFEDGRLGSLITRRFIIERGGTVQWTGDPGNVILNVSAIYSTRASLAPVLSHNGNNWQRVNVQSVISIDGRLPQPNIKFDFRLPNVDDDIRTQFFSVINRDNANEMSQQTFSLLLFGGFTAPRDNTNIVLGTNNPASMAWDIAINQLNNILQNMTGDNINIGVNYRPADLNTTQQFQATVSTQFLDNRLLIDGHVGQGGLTRGSETPDNSQVMHEINVEWRLTNRLNLKAFRRPNEREFSRASQLDYLQGAGIAYRREFNSFRPFFIRRKKDTSIDE